MAEYAHGSAEPLIVTALLAAAFVLVFLRPGSVASQNSTVRLLVYVWIVQNIFLVGSSMLRTANYIEAYSLTGMRVAALIWMMLVAIGLMLIVWRIAMHRSGSWLINANALCLAIVLAICSFTSFDAIIARWNIAHSFQARSDISRIDLDYLRSLGSGALVPMAEVTVNGGAGATGQTLVSGEALAMIRARLQERVEKSQADWRHWTVSDALRLRAATALPAAIPTHSSDPL